MYCLRGKLAEMGLYETYEEDKMLENDLLHYAMIRAARKFNGDTVQSQRNGLVFNLACLSNVLQEFIGIKGCIDGNLLQVLLVGRTDVDILSGGSHYQLRT